MTLPRDEVSAGLLDELSDFEKLVRSLDDQQWSTPSRCEGWTVGDVAAHVIGSMADVVGGRLDGLGTPEVTEREVQERRGRTPAQLADECAEVREAAQGLLAVFDDAAWEAPAPGGYQGTLGDGVEALWFDTYLHADDMRSVARPGDTAHDSRATRRASPTSRPSSPSASGSPRPSRSRVSRVRRERRRRQESTAMRSRSSSRRPVVATRVRRPRRLGQPLRLEAGLGEGVGLVGLSTRELVDAELRGEALVARPPRGGRRARDRRWSTMRPPSSTCMRSARSSVSSRV